MKNFTINNKRLLAVEVPDNWEYFLTQNNTITYGNGENYITHRLPAGNWQILGRAGELKEEQAKELVELDGTCLDYELGVAINDIMRSWHSFMQANSIHPHELIIVEI